MSKIRMLPGSLSVRRIFPSGRNARLHGAGRLSISVVILNGVVAMAAYRPCFAERGLIVLFFWWTGLDRLTIDPGGLRWAVTIAQDHKATIK